MTNEQGGCLNHNVLHVRLQRVDFDSSLEVEAVQLRVTLLCFKFDRDASLSCGGLL